MASPFRSHPAQAGPPRASPPGAGPLGAGPPGAGPPGAGPSGAGPSGAGPSGAGPSGAGPSRRRPSGAERSDPEALLAHGAFVRRLARQLVGDGAAADDLAQDAWLVALERPPRGAMRPWLAAVVRNLARTRARDGDRRLDRELRASKPEPGPSPEDVLAREEVRARVVRAVLALPASLRRAVLLRYYEELSPRAIARRLDLPLETVRTHLKRGLAQLRAKLDAEDRDWRRALLPIAFAPPMLGGAPVVAPLAIGLSFAGVVAAVVCCVLFLGRLEHAVRAPVPLVAAATVRVPASAKNASDLVEPEPPAPKLVVEAEALPALGPPAPRKPAVALTGIRGRVVDDFDVPVSNALVFFGEVGRLRGAEPFAPFDAGRIHDGVRTTTDGSFQLEGEGVVLTAWNEAFSAITVKREDAAVAGEDECLLRLPAPGRLSGALPEFVPGARRGARLDLDGDRQIWLDRSLGFDLDFVPAGLHGLQLPDGSLLGVRVLPGQTTFVEPKTFLQDVQIELVPPQGFSRSWRRPDRDTTMVGLGNVFSVPEVRARSNLLSTPLLIAGPYVVVGDDGPLAEVDIDKAHTSATLWSQQVSLKTLEQPGAVLVPAELDDDSRLWIAARLAEHVRSRRSRGTTFRTVPGIHEVVRYVEREDLPPVLIRLATVDVPRGGSAVSWREP